MTAPGYFTPEWEMLYGRRDGAHSAKVSPPASVQRSEGNMNKITPTQWKAAKARKAESDAVRAARELEEKNAQALRDRDEAQKLVEPFFAMLKKGGDPWGSNEWCEVARNYSKSVATHVALLLAPEWEAKVTENPPCPMSGWNDYTVSVKRPS